MRLDLEDIGCDMLARVRKGDKPDPLTSPLILAQIDEVLAQLEKRWTRLFIRQIWSKLSRWNTEACGIRSELASSGTNGAWPFIPAGLNYRRGDFSARAKMRKFKPVL